MIKISEICDCDAIHDEIVSAVKMKMPTEDESEKLSGFFKVFGDNTRIKIMWALDQSEMCVCDLAVLLNMTKSAISHQLGFLKNANLVKFRKDGKVVFYSLHDYHVKEVFEKGLEHIREEA